MLNSPLRTSRAKWLDEKISAFHGCFPRENKEEEKKQRDKALKRANSRSKGGSCRRIFPSEFHGHADLRIEEVPPMGERLRGKFGNYERANSLTNSWRESTGRRFLRWTPGADGPPSKLNTLFLFRSFRWLPLLFVSTGLFAFDVLCTFLTDIYLKSDSLKIEIRCCRIAEFR